jgi:hypothetical protein
MAPGIDFIIGYINHLEATGVEAPSIKGTLKSVLMNILEAAEAARNYDNTLAGMPDATAALKRSIQQLRLGVQHYVSACRKVQRWLDRLS